MSNELTVRISCSIQEMCDILEKKGFSRVDKFNLEDIYYIAKEIDITKQSINEILKRYVLIRKITQFVPKTFIDSYNILKLTLKNKNIADNGEIISQDKVDCKIKNIEDGKQFIKSLGYKELMTIKEKDIVYQKDNFKLAIKNIEDIEPLIEIETSNEFDTIDKLKKKINELKIPIDENDYFVKKAEIELRKILQGE